VKIGASGPIFGVMIRGFLVKKQVMTQKYRQDGTLVPITVCQAEPCWVVGRRTKEKDGYWAVQLAAGRKKRAKKPVLGQLKKAKIKFVPEIIREIRLESGENLPELGEKISVDQVVKPGAVVKARGITKGRGFAGVIKRWGFRSQPATHGQSDRERAPGSIGAQTPGRVIKGKKMPGHYGHVQRTIKNLEVVWVDKDKNELWIKGALPGPRGGWLVLVVEGERGEKFIPLMTSQNDHEKEKTEPEN